MRPAMVAGTHPTLNNIQMLRAIAVLMVALLHLEPYTVNLYMGPTRYLLPFGYSGVDLFFIISGFINYYVSADRVGKPRYALRFLIKRAIRIFPNYWLVVAVAYYLTVEHGMHPAPGYIRPLESVLLLFPLRVPEHIMITAWTLNYELLFYGVLAVLICLGRRVIWPAAALYVLAIALAQTEMDHAHAWRPYEFLLAPYLLQFFAGMGIAALALRGPMPCPRAAIAFGLVMAAITIWVQIGIYPEGFANPYHRDLRVFMWLCAYGPILYGLVALERQGGFTCRNRSVLLLGDASYSLYLWFMPFFFAAFALTQWAVAPVISATAAYFVFAPLTWVSYLLFGCAWYYYLERPMLKRLNRWVLGRRLHD